MTSQRWAIRPSPCIARRELPHHGGFMRRPSRWSPGTGVERGHSSHRRLRFGQGDASFDAGVAALRLLSSRRRFFRAAFLLLEIGFLCLAALMPRAAEARTFVLKVDGTGDVPTFQAG